ncbi:MAG: hypothetical protein IH948_01260, partial [Bacteroidetes bacterium]|nr:hypothetical protein [Bacteroidota bacterium]
MKALKNLLIFILVVIALFISSALIIEYYYGDEVKQKLVNELSKKLNTDVEVSEASFSLLRKFPYATLELTDVMVEETFIKLHKDKDTLLFAERIFLQFNVIDIYTKNYNINDIEVTNGFIHVHIDKQGENNYNFWKIAEDSLDLKKNVEVELEELILLNMDISYINDGNEQDFQFNTRYAEIQGELARKQFTLDISADLNIEWLKIGSVNYVDKKEAWIDLNLDVDNNLYTITDGEVHIADLQFNVEGEVQYASNKTIVDLKIDGSKLDIQSALSILPEAYSEEVKKYNSSGKFFFNSVIKGIMSSTKDPGVIARFGIEDGTISKKGSPQELENVTLAGTYTNGANHSIPSSVLDLTDCNFSIGDGNLGGKLKLTNLKYPRIEAEVIGDFDMAKAQEFLRLDTLDIARGLVGINAVLTGRMVDDRKSGGLKMTDIKTKGSLNAKNVDIQLVGSDNLFRTINGKFIFNDNDLLIDEMSFKLDQSDFYLEGFFRNMAQYVLHKDERLTVNAKLNSHLIDFNYLLKSRQSDNDTGYALILPTTVNLNLDVEVDSVIFRRFSAYKIAGKIQLKNSQLAANPLTFETMQGSVTFTGLVDGRNPNEII